MHSEERTEGEESSSSSFPSAHTSRAPSFRYQHFTRRRLQLQQEQEREKERQVAVEERRRKRTAKRQSFTSTSSSSSLSNPSRRGSSHKTARILIIGGGPAGLAAALKLRGNLGYEDVRIVEARDRLGGRVHTMRIEDLVKKRMKELEAQEGRTQEECKDESDLPSSSSSSSSPSSQEMSRLRKLLEVKDLGVVDEGAAFIHGYFKDNPVYHHFLRSSQVKKKSETWEEWWEAGKKIDRGIVVRARNVYSYVDAKVLEEVKRRVEEEDRPLQVSFDEQLQIFWQQKQQKWQREMEGEEITEEVEDDFYKEMYPIGQQEECALDPLSPKRRLELMPLMRDILQGLRTSQHCYVAAGAKLSSLDLVQSWYQPALVDPEVIPLRGYSELIHGIYRKLMQMRMEHPTLQATVQKVEEKGPNTENAQSSYIEVTVRYADGSTDLLIADYCIITVPISVLQRNAISFTPSLSSVHPASHPEVTRQQCIDKLAMGLENKVILCWAVPWWKVDDDIQYFRSVSHPLVKVIKLDALSTSPYTLVMHFAPPLSSHIERLSHAEAGEEAMKVLRDMFGDIPQADFVYRTAWGVDELSGGSYSYVPVGSSSLYSGLLAEESWESRILFAGEHCGRSDMQTVHGAYRSGEDAAVAVKKLIDHHGADEAECRTHRRIADSDRLANKKREMQMRIVNQQKESKEEIKEDEMEIKQSKTESTSTAGEDLQIDKSGRQEERVSIDAAKLAKETEIEEKEVTEKEEIQTEEENGDEEDDGLPLSMLMMKRHSPALSQPAAEEEEKEEKAQEGYAVLRHSSRSLFDIKCLSAPASSLRENEQESSPNSHLSIPSPPVRPVVASATCNGHDSEMTNLNLFQPALSASTAISNGGDNLSSSPLFSLHSSTSSFISVEDSPRSLSLSTPALLRMMKKSTGCSSCLQQMDGEYEDRVMNKPTHLRQADGVKGQKSERTSQDDSVKSLKRKEADDKHESSPRTRPRLPCSSEEG